MRVIVKWAAQQLEGIPAPKPVPPADGPPAGKAPGVDGGATAVPVAKPEPITAEVKEGSLEIGGETIFGRDPSCQWVGPPTWTFLSRRHFAIRLTEGGAALNDLGSTGGTKHNGNPVSECQLANGDTITAGDIVFSVEITD